MPYDVVCLFASCAEQGGYADGHRWLGNLMRICVLGFVFISGYFGLRFSWKHIWKILGICFYCMLVIGVLNLCRGVELNIAFIRDCYGDIQGAWFVWCYLALMIVAPVLNPLFEKPFPLRTAMPTLCICFGWSYFASVVPMIKSLLPYVHGFGPFGLLTFVGVYVVGRICRVYEVEKKITPLWYVCGMSICAGMMMAGFHHYCSPFNVGFVVLLFCLFKKLPTERKCNYFVWLAPSMFSVYLIHDSSAGMYFLRT